MEHSSRILRTLTAALAVALVAAPLAAQQGTVTGRVTDQQSGQPLAAVQIVISEISLGSLSSQDGRYTLANVPVGTHTVSAQRLGYQTVSQEVTVEAGATVELNLRMGQAALALDDIIITGTPGGTQRRAIGNSVLSVSASEITENAVQQNVQGVLRGRNPGVMLGAGSGTIGSGADITIRGTGSFDRSRTQPLIYVDGVRVNNSNDAGPAMAQGQGLSNVMNDFNPNDIESIEIIKGPAAATLYGTEASAGVIQIITKKGAEGAPQFNISVAQGRNFIRGPNQRMGTLFACNNTPTIPCPEENIVPYELWTSINAALRDGTFNPEWNYDNWPQDNIWQYGPSESYNLGVRGGTERIRYFVSGNYDRDEGPVFYNWNEAMRLRGNLGVVLSDQFSLDVSTGFVSGETSYATQAGTRGGVWDQGAWGTGYCVPYVALERNPCPRVLGFQQMIPTDVAKVSSTREYDRFTGSAQLNFNLGNWLSSRAVIGIDKGWDTNNWVHPIENNQAVVIQETLDGTVVYERPLSSDFSSDISGTITLPVGESWTTATSAGFQFNTRTREFFGNVGQGFASPLSRTINQTPVTRASIEYEYVENKSLGLYVQEQIGWNERIFLTGAVRFDDNSAFGGDFDPVIYPKFSGSWVVSEEPFWDFRLVDELRVRGAWGMAGRQPDTFAGVNTFEPIAGPGGTSALNPASTGNTEVGPEKSTELELGFEFSALEGRLGGEFNWYNQQNKDNLLGIVLAPSLGQGGAFQANVGRIDNWGWEASLRARVYEGSNVDFNIDFTGAYVMNEIKELGDFPGNNDIRIGWSYPAHGGYGGDHAYWHIRAEYDENGPIVDPHGRRIQSYCDSGIHLDPAGGPSAGSQYGHLLGGELVPCQEMGAYLIKPGHSFHPYTWSMTPSLSLGQGRLNMHALFDAGFGRIYVDQMKLWHHRYNTAYGAVSQNDPLYSAAHRLGRWSQGRYFDGDFIKLREVGVRYQLPDVLAERIGADRAAVAFSGRELANLFTAHKGLGYPVGAFELDQPPAVPLDPETGRAGLGDGGHRSYPPGSSFHVRFDVSF